MRVIRVGDTFLGFPSRSGQYHLTFVIAKYERPYEVPKLLVVNASTLQCDSERTCILSPTDSDAHPWIRHDSYVCYCWMEVMTEEVIREHDRERPASPALVKRIQQGALLSTETPRQYKPHLHRALATP
ncbi:MAG: hypothetical protein FWD57_02545 [Polyangiaceae bacterium]|nr:hypothetical protein [Polyangiaceae bacterium]